MLNPGVAESKPESVDVKEYLAVLLKRKWLVLVCFLLSMAGTTAFLFTRQPIYRSNAKLLVTTAGMAVSAPELVKEDDNSFYATQIDIMLSQTMLRRVQQRIKKTAEEIRENLSDLKIAPIRGSAIILITVDSPSRDFAQEFSNALCEEYLRFREEQRAASSESALLTLTREINRLSQELKSSEERYVAYSRENELPMLDATSAALWRTYYLNLATFTQLKQSYAKAKGRLAALEANDPSAFIALIQQAPTASTNPAPAVESAPQATVATAPGETPGSSPTVRPADPVAAYLSPSPEKTTPSANPTNTLPGELIQSISERALARAVSAMPSSLVSGLIELENRRGLLQAQVDDLSRKYKPLHPVLSQKQQELEEVNRQISIKMSLARNIQKADLDSLSAEVQSAAEDLKKSETLDMAKASALLGGTVLRDDMDRTRALYNAMLTQLARLDSTQNFRARNVTVLEHAILEPEAVYPKKMKGLLIAAFFGLGLGLALAFFIEYIDDSIKLAEEVERDLQLPFLGMIPAAQWSPDDLTAHRLDKLKQQGGVAEAYRVVRSAIIFSTPREKLRSILLTSAVPREGKTTTCVNLSIGFAQIEERVLLIDGDLRRGEVHKYFGFERDKGLSDVLLGEATCDQVVKHTSIPKLDVISSGAYPANPAELLLGWRLKEMLEWAYKNYDRVIIDCTPVMGIADSAILGSAVDGCLFVIWAGRTSRRYVRVAKMTAVSRGAKIFGFVLNNLEPGRVGYYHYYPYYYSYYSRGYYNASPEEAEAGKGGDIKGIEVPSPEGGEEEIDDVY